MPNLQDFSDDLKTLIGEPYFADYLYQEQERELAALLAEDYNALEREAEERAAWKGASKLNGVLIKKQCEHSSCPHFRCERGLRIGGIEI